MTQVESAVFIIKHGGRCFGISCSQCCVKEKLPCVFNSREDRRKHAQEYLLKNGGEALEALL